MYLTRGDLTVFENAFRQVDDIPHEDAGCPTELDYVYQSSWILFLMYLDDFETERAESAALTSKPYNVGICVARSLV